MSRILITGGSGFLGRNLASALQDRGEVVLGARNQKQLQAAARDTGVDTTPLDVCNMESVRDAMNSVRPEVVIHAAATKFVDLAEKQPMECVDVNVLGSQNVARAAVDHGVDVVLGISTDKAAPPAYNIYGLSKSIMERMFVSMSANSDTSFGCVRYGNVAWSTGSVLPIWKRMIETNGVIESTGPKMSRFFFVVDEAVELISTALDNPELVDGKVLSREMKGALMSRVLDIWCAETGVDWIKIDGRPGDRPEEYLIGESECRSTSTVDMNGLTHYVITPNAILDDPLPAAVSSRGVTQLTDDEIRAIVLDPPALEHL
jgi:UDP-N-acetylglucosamine 4,6-dehydratase